LTGSLNNDLSFILHFITIIAVPGVARGFLFGILKKKIRFKKNGDFRKKNVKICLAYFTPWEPMSSLKKCHPIWSSRLASYS